MVPGAAPKTFTLPGVLQQKMQKLMAAGAVVQQGGVLPAPKTVSVRELSGLPTAYAVRTSAPWLTVTAASGATPASIGVNVNPDALRAGRYDGTVTVT